MDRLTFEGDYCKIVECTEAPAHVGLFCVDNACCQNKQRWERLKAYEDAEEQGRLIVLPCKVGDTVWMLGDEFNGKTLVPKAKPRVIDGIGGNSLNMIWMVSKKPFELRFHPSEFGKTVFLTREEAEAALKGEQKE